MTLLVHGIEQICFVYDNLEKWIKTSKFYAMDSLATLEQLTYSQIVHDFLRSEVLIPVETTNFDSILLSELLWKMLTWLIKVVQVLLVWWCFLLFVPPPPNSPLFWGTVFFNAPKMFSMWSGWFSFSLLFFDKEMWIFLVFSEVKKKKKKNS